jgi:hypothetical protein
MDQELLEHIMHKHQSPKRSHEEDLNPGPRGWGCWGYEWTLPLHRVHAEEQITPVNAERQMQMSLSGS